MTATRTPADMGRVPRVLCAAALIAAGIGACAEDDGDTASGGDDVASGWAERLELLPAPRQSGTTHVVLADLDVAAEIAGVDHREPDGFLDAVGRDSPAWLTLPETFAPVMLANVEDYRASVGWSPLDVAWAAELADVPTPVAVLEGTFDLDDLEAANGDAVDGSIVPDDIGAIDLESVGPGRPLGMAHRFDLDGDRLWVSRRSDDPRDGGRLTDDARVRRLAVALDGADVYTAELLIGSGATFTSIRAAGLGGPDAIEELQEHVLPETFTAIAVGVAPPVDGEVPGVLVHHHLDDEGAQANAQVLEQLLDGGVDAVRGEPFDGFLADVSVTVDGPVVSTSFTWRGGERGVFLLLHQSALAVHR